MAKAKKITIKYFLNKKLMPFHSNEDSDLYPLYVQITFMRKTLQMSVGTLKAYYFYWSEDFFKKCIQLVENQDGSTETSKDLIELEKLIRDFISKNYEKHGDKFSLKDVSQAFGRKSRAVINRN